VQTNKVDAECDKLATELRWQRFTLKVVNFQLLHLLLTYTHVHLAPPLGVNSFRDGTGSLGHGSSG